MLASCRRRRFRGILIFALCALCVLYIIGAGLLEIRRDTDQSKSERSNDGFVGPNVTWIKTRQGLLSTVPLYGLSKVVLYSYMRGGSTLFSHVFNIDPQPAILWYEALDAFHVHHSGMPYYSNPLRLLYHNNQTRRSLDAEKRLAMTNYLENLLNCDYGVLPLETLSHRFISVSTALKGFWDCMKDLPVSMFYLRQLIPSSSCQAIEFGPVESDLRIVRCSEVFRFLRDLHSEQRHRGDRPVDLLQRYLDQREDNELRKSVMGVCGDFWKRQVEANDVDYLLYEGTGEDEYEFETTAASTTTAEPFEFEGRCRTIQNEFSKFLSATWFTRSLNEQTRPCRSILRSSCARTRLVVAGIHRASMSDLEPLIQRMPEVNLIYYVRDPRAIAVSRADPLTMQTYLNASSGWTVVNESEFLCRRMWDDLESKRRLERRYPGSILTVRYEDFLLDLRGTVTRVYDQILRKVPDGFDRWANETMNADTYDGIFGIRRRNSKEHISKWRSRVSDDERLEMTQHCRRVLEHLGYQI